MYIAPFLNSTNVSGMNHMHTDSFNVFVGWPLDHVGTGGEAKAEETLVVLTSRPSGSACVDRSRVVVLVVLVCGVRWWLVMVLGGSSGG